MRCACRLQGLAAGACAALLCGCATTRTLVDYQPGDPVYFAGTRLDLAAIRHDDMALRRFHATPPAWPWLDLPFSLTADLFVWIVPRTPTPLPGAPDG